MNSGTNTLHGNFEEPTAKRFLADHEGRMH